MATPDVQTLPYLDNGPALLVFLSPRRFQVMSPAEVYELRERIDEALEQLQPKQQALPLINQLALLEGAA